MSDKGRVAVKALSGDKHFFTLAFITDTIDSFRNTF